MHRMLLMTLAALTGAGCYTFTPLDRATVGPGEPVRVTLSPEGGDYISQITGRHARAVEGVFVEWSAGRMVVALPVPSPSIRGTPTGLRQEVPIAAADVLLVERREFDRSRTALVLAATGTVAGLVLWRAQSGGGGGPGGPDNGGPVFLRVLVGPP
jgi:hypothetical protein